MSSERGLALLKFLFNTVSGWARRSLDLGIASKFLAVSCRKQLTDRSFSFNRSVLKFAHLGKSRQLRFFLVNFVSISHFFMFSYSGIIKQWS